MAVNLLKYEQLEKAAGSAWKWLRRNSRYKKDYLIWQRKVKNGSLREWHVTLADYLKQRNALKACGFVPNLEKSFRPISLSQIAYQDCIQEKWGFYPLADPSKPETPLQLFHFFEQILGKGCFQDAVEPVNITYLELLWHDGLQKNKKRHLGIKLPPLPDKLRIDVDYRQSKNLISKEISRLIDLFRLQYKIKEERPRANNLDDLYRTYIMQQLNMSKSSIRKKLFPRITNPDCAESFRKRVARLYKKTLAISSK